MTIWLDAQLSPQIARWISEHFGVDAVAVRDLGLRDAADREIFEAARRPDVVVITKDVDFVHLVNSYGPPPQVLWLTCGNTSNTKLRLILEETLPDALRMLAAGERIVEIRDIA